MPEEGRITATVDELEHDLGLKVRMVIWSGPDFTTPAIKGGAIFEDRDQGRTVAAQVRGLCRLLGIPVEGERVAPPEPLLPEVREGEEYPMRGDN